MCGTPYLRATRRACVPFPAPTGPRRTRSRWLPANEAPVIAHDELGFELAHRVQRYADDDQHSRAGNRQGLKASGRFDEVWQHSDQTKEQRSMHRNTHEHGGQVLMGWSAWTNTWNKPVLALQVLGDVLLLENDERIEERKCDDHDEVQQPVDWTAPRVEGVVDGLRDSRDDLVVTADEVTRDRPR